ncbi:MAG: gliding motility-associated C-terminal domain-containing protein, partial [Draconibacterium sp.]|nr:gliding motility-associated C-terminal domain-containing protein [Draconibacterium sp.]
FPNAKVEIYNRWGNLVFEKENFGNINHWGSPSLAWWDGRSNKGLTVGKDKLPPATYFYILYYNDGTKEPKAGSIFLNR